MRRGEKKKVEEGERKRWKRMKAKKVEEEEKKKRG